MFSLFYVKIEKVTGFLEVKEMAEITKEAVLKTADLARLAISEEEAEMYSDQLTSILTFTEKLNELDTTDVAPTVRGISMKNIMRQDEPKQIITKEQALDNAPDHEDGQFKVPAIMD